MKIQKHKVPSINNTLIVCSLIYNFDYFIKVDILDFVIKNLVY